jgi:hypothetical protein
VLRRRPRLDARVRGENLGHLQGGRDRLRGRVHLADGKIVRSDQLLGRLDLGPGKPEHIFAQTGRLPAFAGGNADVDIEMLTCAKFALLVNHDDADREFAYTKAAEKALAKAEQLGWAVVSIRNDWTTVFKNDGAA